MLWAARQASDEIAVLYKQHWGGDASHPLSVSGSSVEYHPVSPDHAALGREKRWQDVEHDLCCIDRLIRHKYC